MPANPAIDSCVLNWSEIWAHAITVSACFATISRVFVTCSASSVLALLLANNFDTWWAAARKLPMPKKVNETLHGMLRERGAKIVEKWGFENVAGV